MTYFVRNERRKKGRIEFSKFEKKIGKKLIVSTSKNFQNGKFSKIETNDEFFFFYPGITGRTSVLNLSSRNVTTQYIYRCTCTSHR